MGIFKELKGMWQSHTSGSERMGFFSLRRENYLELSMHSNPDQEDISGMGLLDRGK